ncbi:MAG: EF-P beta-lysylation protein EpmB [Parachlamydia sp.]|nr:EF-P beta-lysylation protein EpmB [Parachlamydia sp.]
MLQLSEVSHWRRVLRTNFTNWRELSAFLELDEQQQSEIAIRPDFPLNLPHRLAQKIAKGTLDDPILRQFLPTHSEAKVLPGFAADPVGDEHCQKTTKLLQKYRGRVLLVCTSACAMHCRYCFRQNFDYDVELKGFANELEQIAADPSIREVILSGGDPLSLSDAILEGLIQDLASIPHLRRLRFHTRFPIGIPERIDQSFLGLLERVPLQTWFVIHANHPRELDEDVLGALQQLQRRGVTILNQAVLLKGVNDSADVLSELSERLVDNGILPYYLHQLDRVQGSGHFEVPEAEGHALIDELQKRLSGYAVPKYVREVAGESSKRLL